MIKQNLKSNFDNSNRGFTLIEVIISITILSLLMSMVYTIVSDNTITKDKVLKEDKEFIQIQSALTRFDIDFSQAFSPLYFEVDQKTFTELSAKIKKENLKNASNQDQSNEEQNQDEDNEREEPFRPTDKFINISKSFKLIPKFDQPEKNTFIFLSYSNRRKIENTKQSQYAWVKYSIETSEDPDKNSEAPKVWIRQLSVENPYNEEFNWDKVKKHILAKNIESLSFEFWDRKKEKFSDSLKFLPKPDNFAPHLIKITLKWRTSNNNSKEEIYFSKVLFPKFETTKDEIDNLSYPKKDTASDEKEEKNDNENLQ